MFHCCDIIRCYNLAYEIPPKCNNIITDLEYKPETFSCIEISHWPAILHASIVSIWDICSRILFSHLPLYHFHRFYPGKSNVPTNFT